MQDGKTLRCVDAGGQPMGSAADAAGEGGAPAGIGEIGALSNEDLALLQSAVTAEVLKRLSQK
ncbi:MAG TPA: hypothetical protein VLR70_12055 [Arthrobacter sp.]|nr:hypothetical protein [Arthrobacter sp.]